MFDFVWLCVRDRQSFLEIPRRALQVVYYDCSQLRLLARPDTQIVVRQHVADTLCRIAWSEVGENPFWVDAVVPTDVAPMGTGECWGLIPFVGRQIDRLAVDDTFLALAVDPDVRVIPEDAWRRFTDRSETLFRAYYRARVNYQLRGVHAGRATLRAAHGQHPEA